MSNLLKTRNRKKKDLRKFGGNGGLQNSGEVFELDDDNIHAFVVPWIRHPQGRHPGSPGHVGFFHDADVHVFVIQGTATFRDTSESVVGSLYALQLNSEVACLERLLHQQTGCS